MPRRPAQGKPEQLLRRLADALGEFQKLFGQNDQLRDRVKALIPVFRWLRSLGAALLGAEAGASGQDRILIYLRKHVGEVVSTEELMVVSGIAEYPRRIRELRVEHGWPIISGATAQQIAADDEAVGEGKDEIGQATKVTAADPAAAQTADGDAGTQEATLAVDEYMLLADQPDEDAARRWKMANTIRNSGGSVSSRLLHYLRENVGRPVTGEELVYVANDATEWARRTREFRTEQGWPVATKYTGRPDLPVGVYVLEEDRQLPVHDRQIPDPERRKALMRDKHTCRDCHWTHDMWNPSDARHLELHHLIPHAKGGSNTAENLITLCNVCHDARHANEKE